MWKFLHHCLFCCVVFLVFVFSVHALLEALKEVKANAGRFEFVPELLLLQHQSQGARVHFNLFLILTNIACRLIQPLHFLWPEPLSS